MHGRWLGRLVLAGLASTGALAAAGDAAASNGQTILQEVTPLLWTILAISIGGAAITYAFLVYSVFRFRDPETRRRNYG
ncbi:MAG: hypothetical protein ACREC5_02290 [Thermoplasmata archaeon]